MSMLIHYKQGLRIQSEVIKKRETPDPIYHTGAEFYLIGDVFNATTQEIQKCGWENNPKQLNNYIGALSVVNSNAQSCTFATDMNGIDHLYYYHKEKEFILSDDFWEIIKKIRPSLAEVNVEWARKILVYTPIGNDTIIKNIKCLLPCQIGRYDVINDLVDIKNYQDYRYSKEVNTVEEGVENMDSILKNTFSLLHRKFGDDVVYGVGLSGGLDSRVIPHYALAEGMKVVGYNICTSRPNHFFLAKSCKNAKKMARIWGIPFSLVEWKADKLSDKLQIKIRNYPLGSGRNTFKYETQTLPHFDILLSGATGMIVGSEMPYNINELDDDELIEAMGKEFIRHYSKSNLKERVKRGLKYLFNINVHLENDNQYDKYFEKEIFCAKKELQNYIYNMKKRNYSNIEIYEGYFFNICGSKNRNGSFESLLGSKRSFSIYVPFLLKETLRWNEKLLSNRRVLKQLIIEKIPEVNSVPTESYCDTPNGEESTWRKCKDMLSLIIRGNGTAIDKNSYKTRKVKSAIRATFSNPCHWFYSIFNKEEIDYILKEYDNSSLIIGLWELKGLVDYIEKKEYIYF